LASHSVLSLVPFFFTPTATPELYTLSLHDALPISAFYRVVAEDFQAVDEIIRQQVVSRVPLVQKIGDYIISAGGKRLRPLLVLRSEEHTSELQSRENLVCRLLLEKKKKKRIAVDAQ